MPLSALPVELLIPICRVLPSSKDRAALCLVDKRCNVACTTSLYYWINVKQEAKLLLLCNTLQARKDLALSVKHFIIDTTWLWSRRASYTE